MAASFGEAPISTWNHPCTAQARSAGSIVIATSSGATTDGGPHGRQGRRAVPGARARRAEGTSKGIASVLRAQSAWPCRRGGFAEFPTKRLLQGVFGIHRGAKAEARR